ncbi:TKL/TKL-ccin protein kinase [Coprinopsis sp. MPI-PUGE-AT-0042]|nr:TKL/TKL-ccin protein kinase [Coprinopsis sp. MPI-PUGE-AT-0042]
MVDNPPYFPPGLWKSWFRNDCRGERSRIHLYDVYDNDLAEINQAPPTSRSIFADIACNSDGEPITITEETQRIYDDAEEAFDTLQEDAMVALDSMTSQLQPLGLLETSTSDIRSVPELVTLPRSGLSQLRRYLVFIRFRNSPGYSTILWRLRASEAGATAHASAFKHFLIRMKRRYMLECFADFLRGDDRRWSRGHLQELGLSSDSKFVGLVRDVMERYCWGLLESEICLGVTEEEHEFVIPGCCYGILDDGTEEERDFADFFIPISPSVAIYIIGESDLDQEVFDGDDDTPTIISVGQEMAIDVHLRNAMILQTYPPYIVFSSLRSISLSVSSYYEFRSAHEHHDYARLRMHCRQKFLQEGVVKTLVLREDVLSNGADVPVQGPPTTEHSPSPVVTPGSEEVRVFDLSDAVELKGEWAVGFGTFSDVWEGVLKDPIEKREKAVAVKFLRQAMVKNVKERLIRRLQAEVATWHKLCHRNVSQFFGIVQTASSIGMVSPWYCNGTLSEFTRKNTTVDRLKLLIQVASGICHLHSFNPPIVHGDLKGGNILIDTYGEAIITDFGLSKVMEETLCARREEEFGATGRGTSIFAGSTRWMAPELIMALVEDDGEEGPGPKITTMSDVYAFGSICLELATDDLPYPHRKTDYSVTLDVIRGVLPRRTEKCLIQGVDQDKFWQILEQCWSLDVDTRPAMWEALHSLDALRPPTPSPKPFPLGLTTGYTRRHSSHDSAFAHTVFVH